MIPPPLARVLHAVRARERRPLGPVAVTDRRHDVVAMLIAAVAGATATAGWWMDQRRGRRRNERGACGVCGRAWTGDSSAGPFLMHGRLVCGHCASRAKRRVGLQFALLATASATASGLIVASSGLVAFVAFPLVSTGLMTVGAVRAMKSANRAAQWKILVGDYPPCRLLD